MNISCCCCIWSVAENDVAVVTKYGGFDRLHFPGGPYFMNPCFEGVYSFVSLRQHQVPIVVKTKVDKAEVTLTVQVQYRVVETPEGIEKSQFTLANPVQQIKAYVQDVLRSAVSELSVEKVFDSKDEIGTEVHNALQAKMSEYGYKIEAALVTDVEPSRNVKKSFNLNNLNKFLKDADKFQQMINTSVRNTKSEAEKMRDEILGQGISQQRQEIVNGLKSSIDQFTEEISGVKPRDVLELVLITQYFDMLKDVGVGEKCKIVFTPGNEKAGAIRDAILQGNE